MPLKTAAAMLSKGLVDRATCEQSCSRRFTPTGRSREQTGVESANEREGERERERDYDMALVHAQAATNCEKDADGRCTSRDI